MKSIEPPDRMLHGWVDTEENKRLIGIDSGYGTHSVGLNIVNDENPSGTVGQFTWLRLGYPYNGWEDLCKHFECDPATGRKLVNCCMGGCSSMTV